MTSFKSFFVKALSEIVAAEAVSANRVCRELFAEDATFFGPQPINDLYGSKAIAADYFGALKRAFPDLGRMDMIAVEGEDDAGPVVALMGHLVGTFTEDWIGIPASNKLTFLRYGEVHRWEGRKIIRSHVIVDTLDVMHQAGCWPLPPSLGAEGLWLPPAGEGLRLALVEAQQGHESFAQVRAMQSGLLAFDGVSLASMNQKAFWNPDFLWYGPSGIGTTRGLSGFEAHHQIPFLRAFPDRKGGQHMVRAGDGPFAVTGGWPSVTATHSGDGWLGLPATGKRVGMRVMDFYRVADGRILENWVPIDIADVLIQLGYNVFERLAHLRGTPRRSL